jgi:hypothetical protein
LFFLLCSARVNGSFSCSGREEGYHADTQVRSRAAGSCRAVQSRTPDRCRAIQNREKGSCRAEHDRVAEWLSERKKCILEQFSTDYHRVILVFREEQLY